MKKDYLLLFATNRTIKDVTSEFEERLDLEFEERSSDYIGEYSKSINNHFMDRLTIEPNFVIDTWKEETIKNYSTLIYISFSEEKNKDKKAMVNHLKKGLFKYFNDVFFIREKIYDGNGNLFQELSLDEINQFNDRKINRQNHTIGTPTKFAEEEE